MLLNIFCKLFWYYRVVTYFYFCLDWLEPVIFEIYNFVRVWSQTKSVFIKWIYRPFLRLLFWVLMLKGFYWTLNLAFSFNSVSFSILGLTAIYFKVRSINVQYAFSLIGAITYASILVSALIEGSLINNLWHSLLSVICRWLIILCYSVLLPFFHYALIWFKLNICLILLYFFLKRCTRLLPWYYDIKHVLIIFLLSKIF